MQNLCKLLTEVGGWATPPPPLQPIPITHRDWTSLSWSGPVLAYWWMPISLVILLAHTIVCEEGRVSRLNRVYCLCSKWCVERCCPYRNGEVIVITEVLYCTHSAGCYGIIRNVVIMWWMCGDRVLPGSDRACVTWSFESTHVCGRHPNLPSIPPTHHTPQPPINTTQALAWE